MLRTLVAVSILFAAVVVAADDRPIIVIARPSECPDERRAYCEAFDAALAHPAMQRRLDAVTLERRETSDVRDAYLAVATPSGAELMRWRGLHDWTQVAELLTRIGTAGPNLLTADHALRDGDLARLERHWTLSLLAFGDRQRGRAFLEAMQHSESAGNREIGAIWLEQFERRTGGQSCEEILERLARHGSTSRVRFEATMAMGDLHYESGVLDRAVEAYARAIDLAPVEGPSKAAAIAARDRAEAVSPLLGLAGMVVSGRRSVQLRNVRKNTASVEYRLDGESQVTARTMPFTGTVQFGRLPTRRVLEVVSRAKNGRVLDRTRVVVNERSEAFAVEFLEPSQPELSGDVDVDVTARVPRGRRIEEVAIEWNGSVVARFTAPPFRTRIHVRPGELGYLRAVLRLDDGSETEDVRMSSMALAYQTGAHLLEVPAYFEQGATRAAVTVRENGVSRRVEQVVPPADAPLEIALLIDSSGSMAAHMLDVQEAAARFVETALEPRDRVMLVAFDSVARVVVRPTTNHPAVINAILSLQPGGATALHDALITALLQLQTTGTRKALVVFSDGLDGTSTFTSNDVAEIARRSGVPIYVLAFSHFIPSLPRLPGSRVSPATDAELELRRAQRRLMGLSDDSGGQAFEMRSLDHLTSQWARIGDDVRKQSLVIYRTADDGPAWRSLEITHEGKRVRAPGGVYVTTRDQ